MTIGRTDQKMSSEKRSDLHERFFVAWRLPDGVVVGRWQRRGSEYRPELLAGSAVAVGRVFRVDGEALPQVSEPCALRLPVSIPEEDDHGKEQDGTCGEGHSSTMISTL